MKAYLFITATIFGVLAVLHFWRAIADWNRLGTDPWSVVGTAAIGAVAAALSIWAWKLFPKAGRQE